MHQERCVIVRQIEQFAPPYCSFEQWGTAMHSIAIVNEASFMTSICRSFRCVAFLRVGILFQSGKIHLLAEQCSISAARKVFGLMSDITHF